MRVGVIGCGTISKVYLTNLLTYSDIDVTAVSDIDLARAQSQAEIFGISQVKSPEECFAAPEIDLIVNLTVPEVHAAVTLEALSGGKHVYSEKPLGVNIEEGKTVLNAAERWKRMVGAAPDTFLGAGVQKCRELIDAGAIGRPISFHASMLSRGPERWHANPFIFYRQGAGPLFDFGPYYLTAIVNLLGPVAEVESMSGKSFSYRVAGHHDIQGQKIPVEVPTHVMAHLRLASGIIGSFTMSFDVAFTETPHLEIYGTEGTLSCPDPNTYGGPVRIRKMGSDIWKEMPLSSPYIKNCRGLGVRDLAQSVEMACMPRANGQLAYHILETMEGILTSGVSGHTYSIASRVDRPRMGAPYDQVQP
jgi:predicted dehydrogenase